MCSVFQIANLRRITFCLCSKSYDRFSHPSGITVRIGIIIICYFRLPAFSLCVRLMNYIDFTRCCRRGRLRRGGSSGACSCDLCLKCRPCGLVHKIGRAKFSGYVIMPDHTVNRDIILFHFFPDNSDCVFLRFCSRFIFSILYGITHLNIECIGICSFPIQGATLCIRVFITTNTIRHVIIWYRLCTTIVIYKNMC